VKFQEDPKFRFFVGNSTTAGAGITLHAACNLFLFESEWNPGDNEQMIKRIRRIGQKRQQHARFVTLSKSYDETLIEIIIRKTKEIANAQGNLTTLPQVAFAA
jgi:SNF2 family DNA or RNA helicase